MVVKRLKGPVFAYEKADEKQTAMDDNGSEEGGGGTIAREITSRVPKGAHAEIHLSDGQMVRSRRFAPIGAGDRVKVDGQNLYVQIKKENAWVNIGPTWSKAVETQIFGQESQITFKEIESEDELRLFEELRKFHYRGGGGAGRTVPIIAVSHLWDLPKVLGFIEISSSMIANSARKQFFNSPYWEPTGLGWNTWDRKATKELSNLICRISRFVIHPEVRGLGIAKLFTSAAREFAMERWHYGGLRPRFLEITADMLRYYKFVDSCFAFMGETEGNGHRLGKDMTYLVGRALSPSGAKGMPQGGGGIMTLQRSYATQLLNYMQKRDRGLSEAINSLRYEPGQLDQETWESLHRLNRRPKPSYVAGLTKNAQKYVHSRLIVRGRSSRSKNSDIHTNSTWYFRNISVIATSSMSQTTEARTLQDIFGFVGVSLEIQLFRNLSFDISRGTTTLICGASGSGKSLLLNAIKQVINAYHSVGKSDEPAPVNAAVKASGIVDRFVKLGELNHLSEEATPLELRGDHSIEDFLEVTASCGLAEPQLFVRPISSLSSGQKYRLQVAMAFLEKPEIVLIDNFCESLDRYTALAICNGISRLSKRFQVGVIVATAAYERLINLFAPSQVILLRRGDHPIVTKAQSNVTDV